jgi:HK97 gp10 family phage protein
MSNENGLRVNIKNTIDTKQIQALMNEAHIDILVGFKGGQQHHMDVKRKKKKDGYKNIHGVEPENIKSPDIDQLARMQHFGTADIPARPFLTDGIRQNLGKIKRAMQDEAQKVAAGGKANWAKVGTMAVGAIQEFVRGDYYKSKKPNSPKTQQYKNGDTPLIDTAEMINSMTYIVQRQK